MKNGLCSRVAGWGPWFVSLFNDMTMTSAQSELQDLSCLFSELYYHWRLDHWLLNPRVFITNQMMSCSIHQELKASLSHHHHEIIWWNTKYFSINKAHWIIHWNHWRWDEDANNSKQPRLIDSIHMNGHSCNKYGQNKTKQPKSSVFIDAPLRLKQPLFIKCGNKKATRKRVSKTKKKRKRKTKIRFHWRRMWELNNKKPCIGEPNTEEEKKEEWEEGGRKRRRWGWRRDCFLWKAALCLN